MKRLNSVPGTKPPNPIVTSYLAASIRNLQHLIIAFSLAEGFMDAKSTLFFLIYNKIYKVPLFIYSIFTSLFMIPELMRMLYSITSDNVEILKSRRRSYLFIFSVCEVVLYSAVAIIIHMNGSYYAIFIIHLLLKVTNTWRHSILCRVNSSADRIAEGAHQRAKRHHYDARHIR